MNKKKLFINQYLGTILLLICIINFVKLNRVYAALNEQNTDASISVYDIKTEKGIITRFVLAGKVINYQLSTNANKDELYLTLPFPITQPKQFFPKKVNSKYIENSKV